MLVPGPTNKTSWSCWSCRSGWSRPWVELGSCWLLPWWLRPRSKALLLLLLLEVLLWLLLEVLLWLELLLLLEVLLRLGRELLLLLLVEGWSWSLGSLCVPRGLGWLVTSGLKD